MDAGKWFFYGTKVTFVFHLEKINLRFKAGDQGIEALT
jgi:hypothetical protein